jgi:hypothetical protein
VASGAAAGDVAAAGAGAGGGQGGGRGGGNQPPNPQGDGIWKSVDKGKTWQFLVNQNARPMYFSQIRVDPNDPNIVYTGGVDAYKSIDGGKTFSALRGKGHVDNHAIWIDPLNSQHVMYGDDGGLDVTWDGGDTWEAVRLMGTGLAYHASVSMQHPYMVCTGLQDNGSWCGPSSVRSGQGIRMWDWMSVGGGDGFQNAIDPTDPNIFYTESQNAGIQRYDLNTGTSRSIKPSTGGGGRGGGGGGRGAAAGGAAGAGANATPPAAGAAGAAAEIAAVQAGLAAPGGGGRGNVLNELAPGSMSQFNWNSPIVLSPHGPSTIYLGGRQLFISRNRGDTWMATQDMGKKIDLNARQILGVSYGLPGCGRGAGPGQPCILSRNDGYVGNEYGTMTEMAESPVMPGILWAGTDDGNINVSKDGGVSWTEVGHNLPIADHESYVSGLEASWFDAGTAYAAVDRHRNDDLKPYVFKTTDYGATWKAISSNLPAVGNVNSIRQDPVNRNLLFAPTETGFYISLNDGQSWSRFMPNLPVGRMDEVMVHPREHDLILSAHGYSVWIMDDITTLEQMAPPAASQDTTLFKVRDAVAWRNDARRTTEVPGNKFWEGESAPRGTAIAYFLKAAANDVKVTITNTASGQAVRTCVGPKEAGLNRFQWTLGGDQPAGGGGGRGGGGGGAAAAAPAPAAPTGPSPCVADNAGGGGRGGGGGGRGGGGGGIGPGVYRVTVAVDGKEIGSQTFKILEDIWMDEK